MQSKCTTIELNKVGIEFTGKKITAYGGFSLPASFFERNNLRGQLEGVIPAKESSPNSVGIYSKLLAYILMIYAGATGFPIYCILDVRGYYRSFLGRGDYP
jgi:hypothetical protein